VKPPASVPPAAPSTAPASIPPAASKASGAWLLFGALIAIGAGVGIALAVLERL
jgi:hypothetical protein